MKSRTTIWVVLLASLSTLGAWLWFGREIGQVTYLRCVRVEPTQVDCSLRRTWLGYFAIKIDVDTLTNLKQAEFKEECDEDCYYYVVLRARNDVLSIRAAEEDQSKVTQISSFMAGRLDTNVLETSVGGSGWEFMMYALVGVAIILAALSPWWFEKVDESWQRVKQSPIGQRVIALLSVWLMRLFLVAIAVGTAYVGWQLLLDVGKVSTLTCTRRGQGLVGCEVHESMMGWVPLGDSTISSLREVRYESDCDSDGCSNTVILLTSAKTLTISAIKEDRVRVERLSAFVKNEVSAENITVQFGGDIVVVVILLVTFGSIPLFTLWAMIRMGERGAASDD